MNKENVVYFLMNIMTSAVIFMKRYKVSFNIWNEFFKNVSKEYPAFKFKWNKIQFKPIKQVKILLTEVPLKIVG